MCSGLVVIWPWQQKRKVSNDSVIRVLWFAMADGVKSTTAAAVTRRASFGAEWRRTQTQMICASKRLQFAMRVCFKLMTDYKIYVYFVERGRLEFDIRRVEEYGK